MELRRLNLNDFSLCFANRLRALEASPTAFLTTIEEERERGPELYRRILSHQGTEQAIFGALKADTIVATVGIRRESERPKLRHRAVIWGVYVDPVARGQRISSRLVELALRFARDEMRAGSVHLCVASDNLGARRLYESHGFQVWGTDPRAVYYGGQFHADDHMVLEL